jgi:sensor domain CHASE-containing protein
MSNLTVNEGKLTVENVINSQVKQMDTLCNRLDTDPSMKIGEFMAAYTKCSQALDAAKKLAGMLENVQKAQ